MFSFIIRRNAVRPFLSLLGGMVRLKIELLVAIKGDS